MQIDNAVITAVISAVAGLIGGLLVFLNQRGKLSAEGQKIVEEAETIVFNRLKEELRERYAQIDRLEAKIEALEEQVRSETAKQNRLLGELHDERLKRQELSRIVKNQGKEIAKLKAENELLRQANREMERRLGTGEFKKKK